MSLGLTRNDGETWRDCVIRYASKYGLQSECVEVFDRMQKDGAKPDWSAWCALGEWDILDYREDKPDAA